MKDWLRHESLASSKIISILSLRYHSLHRTTLSVFPILQRQRHLFGTKTTRAMSFKLPPLPDVSGTDPSRAVLDSFKVAIAKPLADAFPPLTLVPAYPRLDY